MPWLVWVSICLEVVNTKTGWEHSFFFLHLSPHFLSVQLYVVIPFGFNRASILARDWVITKYLPFVFSHLLLSLNLVISLI